MRYFLVRCNYFVNSIHRVPLIESIKCISDDIDLLKTATKKHFQKYEKNVIENLEITSFIEINKQNYDSY